jgi:hypothetical protein
VYEPHVNLQLRVFPARPGGLQSLHRPVLLLSDRSAVVRRLQATGTSTTQGVRRIPSGYHMAWFAVMITDCLDNCQRYNLEELCWELLTVAQLLRDVIVNTVTRDHGRTCVHTRFE